MKVSVLVPYKPDGGRREATWQWLRERWERWHPQPHEQSFGQPTNDRQQALFYRYKDAEGNPDAMREIIAEDGHG